MLVLVPAVAFQLFIIQSALAKIPQRILKTASEITVQIKGAIDGSGVIIKSKDNEYTVLTAWHVVQGNRDGEEVYIVTHDGESHRADNRGKKRIGSLDLAYITFGSRKVYQVASQGRHKDLPAGVEVYVSGFPISSNKRIRIERGRIVAMTDLAVGQGYGVFYDATTYPGMSGGPVLTYEGSLIAIHGRGERSISKKIRDKTRFKTGVNQGISIFALGFQKEENKNKSQAFLDLYSQIVESQLTPGGQQTVIKLADRALEIHKDSQVFLARANAYASLGYEQQALADIERAIQLENNNREKANLFATAISYFPRHSNLDKKVALAREGMSIDPMCYRCAYNLGVVYQEHKKFKEALLWYKKAAGISPGETSPLTNSAIIYTELGLMREAIKHEEMAIQADPKDPIAYSNLAYTYALQGDLLQAIRLYGQAIDRSNDPSYRHDRGLTLLALFAQTKDPAYRDKGCSDLVTAIRLGYLRSKSFSEKYCQQNILEAR